MLTLQKKKKTNNNEPLVVSESKSEDFNLEGIDFDSLEKDEGKKLEKRVQDSKADMEAVAKKIKEKTFDLSGIDFDSIESKESNSTQKLPSQQFDLSGIDLSSLDKSISSAALTQVAPGVVSSKELWNGAKDEELLKLDYDDFSNLSYEEKFKLAAFQHNHPQPTSISNPKKLLKGQPLVIAGNEQEYPSADTQLEAYLQKTAPALIPYLENFRTENGREFATLTGHTGKFQPQGQFWDINYQPTEGLVRSLNAYAKGGMEEYNHEIKKITQENIIYEDTKKSTEKAINDFEKDRSWFSQTLFGFKQGLVDETAGTSLQKLHSYEYLIKAMYTSARYGFNSDEYNALIEEDKKGQTALNEGMGYIRHAEGGIGKFAEGSSSALGQFPNMEAGGQALPILIYLENLHRGNSAAFEDSFKQLPFIAVGGLVGGKLANNIIEKEIATGVVDSFGRLNRQILTRSAQAGISAATELWINQKEYALGRKSLSDIIPESAVAALFPIGGIGKEHLKLSQSFNEIKARSSNPTENSSTGRATGEIPVTAENQPESTQGMVKLPLDLLALNLLEMRRSLVNKSYQKDKAFSSIAENLKYRSNIEAGIKTLEAIVPEHVIDFVSKNEESIREAMRKGFDRIEAKRIIKESKNISEVDKVNTTNDNLDFLSQGRELFGEKGKNNKFVNQGQAAKDVSNVKADFKDTTSSSNLNDATTVLAYMARNAPRLARLGAFYIEAGIRDFAEFSNRVKNDLGEELSGIFGEKRIQKLFEDGQKFYETNNADPFFSSFKQNIVERFPDKSINAQSAWALLLRLGSKNELEWTQGLSKFVQDSIDSGRNITKKQILDIVENGQVKVDEVILGNVSQLPSNYNVIESNKNPAYNYPYEVVNEKGEIFGAGNTEAEARLDALKELNTKPTRYDFKTYASERLELEGGKSPKEVLLQVPERIVNDELYSDPHWNESNIFAHFRANERETIDGKRVFHSEEFQSDWNQSGRKEGYKSNKKYSRFSDAEKDGYKLEKIANNQYRIINPDGTTLESLYTITEQNARQDAYYILKGINDSGVPKNPFMENSWKELAFKRFLRMGIENGKDGVSWTTARQQQERYGKVLEGKTVTYVRNADRSYDLNLDGQEVVRRGDIAEIRRLTNDEFVQHLESQERQHGKFELNEAIKIGNNKYSDYDIYFVNLAKKIGKKFGAEYKVKETDIGESEPRELLLQDVDDIYSLRDKGYSFYNKDKGIIYKDNEYIKIVDDWHNGERVAYEIPANKKVEQVHYLEITPSMRESILKKGQPLYGLNLETLPKGSEKSGIRNRIITLDEHSQVLSELGDALNTQSDDSGQVFNSGLNPEAFAQQIKLLYRGVKDFDTFTSQLTARFGDRISDYTEQLWNYTKAEVNDFKEGVTWREDITPEAQEGINKRLENGEAGRLTLRTQKAQSFEEFKERNFKDRIRILGYAISRGQNLAYYIPEFRQMYTRIRKIRLQLEGFTTNLVTNLHQAYTTAKNLDKVAEVLYSGNIEVNPSNNKRGLVYTDQELQSGISRFGNVIPQLEPGDIKAYRILRRAQDAILSIRQDQQIYKLRKVLNQQTPGSPEYIATRDKIQKVIDHYDDLRNSGYVSLQRRGKYAIYAEDPNFPVGDIRRKVYTHAKSEVEANKIALEYERKGYEYSEVKLIRNNFKNIGELAKKLTPSQLEDLLHSSNANLNSPEVQKIRNEVLSNYSSFGYQLKRDFTRGYKPTWNNLKDTLHHQLEVYSSSYYNNIGREEGMDRLNAANLKKYSITSIDVNNNIVINLFNTKTEAQKYRQGLVGHKEIKLGYPNEPLYETMKSYIDDETSSPNVNRIIGAVNNKLAQARQLTYIYQLGLDASQLIIQATQPFLTTYPHLAKEVLTGLKGIQPEKVFTKSIAATGLILKEGLLNNTIRKNNPKNSRGLDLLFGKNNANEFRQLYQKARAEDVVAAEFAKSLAENELNVGSTLSRITNKASIISRKAELLNRTNAFAAGFLVGKQKNLNGTELYNFAVDFVNNTQGEYSRGENPRVVRAFGEVGKLLYQFESYTQIWFENLATAIHSDVKTSPHKILHGATIRHLGALGVVAGFSGFPFANLMRGLVTAIVRKDEDKNVEKKIQDNLEYYLSLSPKSAESLKNLAVYGVTGNAGISSRLGMEVPFVDNADKVVMGDEDYLSARSLPAVSTAIQVAKGGRDLLLERDKLRAMEDVSPKFLKNTFRGYRYVNKGARDREGNTIVPRGRISSLEDALAFLGFQPDALVKKRQDERFKKLGGYSRDAYRSFKRNF